MDSPLKQKRFRTQREGDPDCAAAQLTRDGHWALFSRFAEQGYDVEDFDATVEKLRSAAGFQTAFTKQAVLAHARLQDLPRLRQLQAETRLLNVVHLMAINNELDELGPDVEQEVFDRFDEMLVDTFTPKRDGQEFPQRGTVTHRIRELIKRIDPTRAYDPKKRKARCANTEDQVSFGELQIGGVVKSCTQILSNGVTGKLIQENIHAAAREHGISIFEAAVKLLTGEITSSTAPILHIYAPKDRQEGDPVYLPGFGWTGPEETAEIEGILANVDPVIVDLDALAEQKVERYAPTDAMRRFVCARDRTCIYPGCQVPSQRCQLDHRIPYEDRGETTPGNLFPLCQHHHNMKTDRGAFYVPDPHTGDIIWLFEDGTYTTVVPDGLLREQITPTCPRWRSTLANVRRKRAVVSEFNAKGHAIMDQFDRDGDLERASAQIEELEEEYGLEFAFRPEMPWEEPLPEEPVQAPFPDPEEEEVPAENPFHEKSFKPKSNVEWYLARAHCRMIMDMVEEAD